MPKQSLELQDSTQNGNVQWLQDSTKHLLFQFLPVKHLKQYSILLIRKISRKKGNKHVIDNPVKAYEAIRKIEQLWNNEDAKKLY